MALIKQNKEDCDRPFKHVYEYRHMWKEVKFLEYHAGLKANGMNELPVLTPAPFSLFVDFNLDIINFYNSAGWLFKKIDAAQ